MTLKPTPISLPPFATATSFMAIATGDETVKRRDEPAPSTRAKALELAEENQRKARR